MIWVVCEGALSEAWIPAYAGMTDASEHDTRQAVWIPAYTGMTGC